MFWLAFFQWKKKRPHSKLKWENMASWFWILLFIIAKCFNPGQLDFCSLAFRCSSSLLKGSVTTFLDWCTYNMMFISSDFVKSVAEINQSDLRELDICQDNCVYLCFSLKPSVYSSLKFPSAPSLWSRNDLNLQIVLTLLSSSFPGVTAEGWSLFHHPESKSPHCSQTVKATNALRMLRPLSICSHQQQ